MITHHQFPPIGTVRQLLLLATTTAHQNQLSSSHFLFSVHVPRLPPCHTPHYSPFACLLLAFPKGLEPAKQRIIQVHGMKKEGFKKKPGNMLIILSMFSCKL